MKVWRRSYYPEDWQLLQEFEWRTGGWRKKKEKEKVTLQQLLGIDKVQSALTDLTHIKRPKVKAFTKKLKRRFQREKDKELRHKKADAYHRQLDVPEVTDMETDVEMRVSTSHQQRYTGTHVEYEYRD